MAVNVESPNMNVESEIRDNRVLVLLFFMLPEEYEAARKKSLITEEDYLELFDHYLGENRSEDAMVIGEKGIKALGSRARSLAERLAALYNEWGEAERARAIWDF